jgi:calcineurin-binding protein cabin-1
VFKWNDWVGKKHVEEVPLEQPIEEQKEVEKAPNGEIQSNSNEAKNEEEKISDNFMSPPAVPEENPTPEESNEDQESEAKKNRRRCSDLDFLKEWGWHKNRRSNRKKQKEEEENVDTTINGFLRRILPNYYTQSFEHTKNNPFLPEATGDENKSFDSEMLDTSKTDAEDEQKFNEFSKESFEEFMATFKERDFDLYIPIYQWVRFVSLYWNKTVIPAEIIALYKKIYAIYEGYINYHGMYHMPEDDFLSSFRAAMLYFELMFEEFEETKAEISDDFMRKKDFLQANIGFIEEDMDCTRMLLRLFWLSYGIQIYHKNYKDAVGFLYKVEEVFDVPKYKEISIELKNCKQNKFIDFK